MPRYIAARQRQRNRGNGLLDRRRQAKLCSAESRQPAEGWHSGQRVRGVL